MAFQGGNRAITHKRRTKTGRPCRAISDPQQGYCPETQHLRLPPIPKDEYSVKGTQIQGHRRDSSRITSALDSTTKREFQRRFQNWGRRWVHCRNSEENSTDQYSAKAWHCFIAPLQQFRIAPRITLTPWKVVTGNDVQLGGCQEQPTKPPTLNRSLLR